MEFRNVTINDERLADFGIEGVQKWLKWAKRPFLGHFLIKFAYFAQVQRLALQKSAAILIYILVISIEHISMIILIL